MLALCVVFVPTLCTADENNLQQLLLKFNEDVANKKMISSEFSLSEDAGLKSGIDTGSVIHYSTDGKTTVFDSNGKQSFF